MNEVNKTLYIPLYGKALMAMRARVFDEWVSAKMKEMPKALVLHIGCGLDARINRISPHKNEWYDIDVATATRIEWIADLPRTTQVIVLLEGISMYLTRNEVVRLFSALHKKYDDVSLLMDAFTPLGAKLSHYKNSISKRSGSQVYGVRKPEGLLLNNKCHYVGEHEMTPRAYINELSGFKKWWFKTAYAGSLAKKIYKIYEYKMDKILRDITITDVAAEGKALARYNDMVIFVPYAVPGDVVDLQIYRKKKRFAEGRVIAYKKYSEKRVEPFCPQFGICGGCKWQNLPYEEQLFYKQKQIVDNLTRIGKIELPEISPILGSKQIREYRNKLEYTFSNKAWLTTEQIQSGEKNIDRNAVGFHIPGMFDKVMHVEKCGLQDDISNQIRNTIHAYCQQNNISYYNLREQHGMMRNLIVRNSMTTGQLMVIVVFAEQDEAVWKGLLSHVEAKFPQITSLLYVCNQKCNDTLGDQEILVWKGDDCIYETMEDLRFKIGPKSFYQTNTFQAYELYKVARNFAELTGNELVYDLYTGTGTIANFVAKRCKQVIGIEYVPEAIEDAKVNAALNGLDNTLFYAGDMKDILTVDFIKKHGKPDVIITDPPRAGMHEDVINAILVALPERIVYVSCNPATQARDLALLDEHYKVAAVQPVDMFPHTQHVENVVQLIKR